MNPFEIVQQCARIAEDKRAEDVLVLETTKISSVADYFLLATARNKRQMKAIAEGMRVELKQHGVRDLHTEGYGSDKWVLLDYGNVVVHVFDSETRGFYDLESLWADAPRLDLQQVLQGRDSA